MPWIGIEKDQGLFYEGTFRHGHAVVPTPVTAPAAIISEAEFPPKLPPSHALEQADLIFREDSFDAVTRVRRGRLYLASQIRPEHWEVYPHPNRPTETRDAKQGPGTVTKLLYTFQPLAVPDRLKEIHDRVAQPLIAIGTETTFTIWSVAALEGCSSPNEYLITLRGRQTFGALPQLNALAIPQACRRAVQDAVAILRDEIFRAGPGSVVDRSRDVASAALSGYLQHLGAIGPGRELDDLVKRLGTVDDPHKRRIAAAGAEIVRVLHSRVKPSVQERMAVPPVREQEAELAVYCVGSLLCELGWAEWR